MIKITATRTGTIADLDSRNDLTLATDSQDVDEIKSQFGGNPMVKDFDGFLVKVEDGDYAEVYGFEGNIPYTWKSVYRIERIVTQPKAHKPRRKASSRKSGGQLGIRGIR